MEQTGRFLFEPPLTTENIQSVCSQVFATLPAADLPRKQYLETSLHSLFEYAQRKKQKQNYTLLVGRYRPDIVGDRPSEEIWGEENVWVEVRVLGGVSASLTTLFMATQLGISRVDWRHRTFRFLKKGSARILHPLLPHTWRPETLEEREKERAQERIVAAPLSKEQLLDCLISLNPKEDGSSDFFELAERLYTELGGSEAGLRTAKLRDFAENVARVNPDIVPAIEHAPTALSKPQFNQALKSLLKHMMKPAELRGVNSAEGL